MQRRWWASVIATVLLLQWVAAFGHCRVIERASLATVSICSAHQDGSQRSDPHAPEADRDCPACHQAPFVAAIAPSVAVSIVRAWFTADVPPAFERRATLGPRAPPPPARAPPSA